MVGIEIILDDAVQTLNALFEGIRTGIATAHQNPEFKESMQDGVADHFSTLEWGGQGIQGLDGYVRWEGYRGSLTMAEREAQGAGTFPMLTVEGEMKRDYTTGARMSVQLSGGASLRATLKAGSQRSAEKARKHHQGGLFRTRYPTIGVTDTTDFPRRQFLFWDSDMTENLLDAIADRIELETQRATGAT